MYNWEFWITSTFVFCFLAAIYWDNGRKRSEEKVWWNNGIDKETGNPWVYIATDDFGFDGYHNGKDTQIWIKYRGP